MVSKNVGAAALAEFIAMALFVWIGCGAAVSSNEWYTQVSDGFQAGTASIIAIATAFGVAIVVLVYGIGHISGGHINPAVTFAFLLRGELSFGGAIFYMLAQFSGAFVGALLLWGSVASLQSKCVDPVKVKTIGSAVCEASCTINATSTQLFDVNRYTSCSAPFNLGANAVDPDLDVAYAFIAETVGTFILLFTVLMTAVHKKSGASPNAAPIAIGWSVMLAHLVLIPLTGCGINPARTFGPAVVASISGSNTWKSNVWVYYIAPFFGSLLATLTFKCFENVPGDDEEGEEEKDRALEEPLLPSGEEA